jgi:probable HAF family extracellular repeat protein
VKSTALTHTTAIALFIAVALTAQSQTQQTRYQLIDMGAFGGPGSAVNIGFDASFSVSVVNNRGTLAGWAETAQPDPFSPFCFTDDCFVAHAFQWQGGVRRDLGALVAGVSSLANWVSNTGLIAGVSENGAIDPLLPGFPQLRAVLWKNGHITDLGTLPEGGYESIANAVNSRGQVIGAALNAISDPNSLGTGGYPTQTRAFLWEDGAMQDLGTLGGTDALAQFINERGQVVGWSYTSSAPNTTCPSFSPLATGSFIWDRRHGMQDLGTLGGTCTLATGLNNSGTVVGSYVDDEQIERGFVWQQGTIQDLGESLGGDFSAPVGINDHGTIAGWASMAGNASFHAALWRGIGKITDLGVVAGDDCSFATAINAKTQIVGSSLGDGCTFDENSNAFLWESGSLYDLNALIPPGASLHLLLPIAINDRGEIAGNGSDLGGNWHAFLLVPCVANSVSDCEEVVADATSAASLRVVSPTRPPLARQGTPIRRMFSRGLAHQHGPRLLTEKN